MYVCVCVCSQLLQSCLTLCEPMDCSPPGSSVHGILQARILEWIAMSSSRYLSHLGIKLTSPALAGVFFNTESLMIVFSYQRLQSFMSKPYCVPRHVSGQWF